MKLKTVHCITRILLAITFASILCAALFTQIVYLVISGLLLFSSILFEYRHFRCPFCGLHLPKGFYGAHRRTCPNCHKIIKEPKCKK